MTKIPDPNCPHGVDIFERCPRCDAAAGVNPPEAQPQVADALTVDVMRGTISLGRHRSFVANAIARAVQKLIVDAKEERQ